MAKQKYERGKLSLRGTKAVQPETQTEKAVEELSKKPVNNTPAKPTAPRKKAATTTKPAARKAKKESEAPVKVKTQRFTVDFPEDRYYEFKMEALKRRTTVKNMLLEAMMKTYGV